MLFNGIEMLSELGEAFSWPPFTSLQVYNNCVNHFNHQIIICQLLQYLTISSVLLGIALSS